MSENKTILNINHISKSFFGIQALKDVSVTVREGEILCIIGENGAGKSTLMNILGGNVKADSGNMELFGDFYDPLFPNDATKAGISFIHQELNLFPNLSVEENIFISNYPNIKWAPFLNKKYMREKAESLLESINLPISPSVLVEKLSPGEKQLVEIAKALNTDPRIIIFDEPTTSLSAREAERLFKIIEQLREEKRSVIYISHILEDVISLHDRIIVLRDGKLTGTLNKNEFTKNTLITLMVGRDINQMYPERKKTPDGDIIFEVKNLSQSGIVKDINFNIQRGEIVGLFGLMGSGRTELARILFGIDPFEKGEIIIGGEKIKNHSPVKSLEKNLAFVTEDRRDEGLIMDKTIFHNLSLAALPHYSEGIFGGMKMKKLDSDAKAIIKSLHIQCVQPHKNLAKSLSGGNQQKAVIGKWLMTSPEFFILDEPTRGIDVGAKYDVYCLIHSLAAKNAGILFISSEIEELIGNCDRILVMSKGELFREFRDQEFDKADILKAAFRQTAESMADGANT